MKNEQTKMYLCRLIYQSLSPTQLDYSSSMTSMHVSTNQWLTLTTILDWCSWL